MTDFRASGEVVPIERVDQLLEQFHAAGRPRATWKIGTEWEKLVVDATTGRAAPYAGPRGIERLLRELADRSGWEPRDENGRVIALARPGASITLEPGGQLELSGEQCATIHCTRKELDDHVRELAAVGAELGLAFLGLGFHPVSALEDIEWVPKPRYAIMREYMTRVGTLGHRMMKQTATVQANIDYADERDAMRKFRAGMGIAPIMNAMFANSPIGESRLNGYMSYRAHVWTDTDRARSWLLPFGFRDDAGFHDYAEWALDVPCYFLLRDGRYRTEVTGVPFRRLLETGFEGKPVTLDDWNLHLTTLFPEVRLKTYLEFRSADSQPPERLLALPALIKGVFYDDDCLGAALDLAKRWNFETCEQVYRDVMREALQATHRGVRILELARELLAIAEEGLRRQAATNDAGDDERIYLEALRGQLATGRSPARVIAEKWAGEWNRRVEPLIEYVRLRPL